MEFLTKIAEENPTMAELIMKVAEEDELSQMSDEEIANVLLNDLTEAGVDINDPEVVNELKTAAESGEVYDYALEKVSELISEDIYENFDKVAYGNGDGGFNTAAASKVVGSMFDLGGAANFGSSFASAPNEVGTVIHSGIDAGISGGYGKLIGTTNQQSGAASAQSKISNLLRGSNMNNIKQASDEEKIDFLFDTIEKSAAEAEQTSEEFLYDLGMEALENELQVNAEPKTIFEARHNEKAASDAAYEFVEKLAEAENENPDDLIMDYAVEKCAEYLDELIEKEAATVKELPGKAWSGLKKGLSATGKGIATAGKATGKGIATAGKAVGKASVVAGKAVGKAGATAGKGVDSAAKWSGKKMSFGKGGATLHKGLGYGAMAAGAAGAAYGGKKLYDKLKEQKGKKKEAGESFQESLRVMAEQKLYGKSED